MFVTAIGGERKRLLAVEYPLHVFASEEWTGVASVTILGHQFGDDGGGTEAQLWIEMPWGRHGFMSNPGHEQLGGGSLIRSRSGDDVIERRSKRIQVGADIDVR